MSCQEWHPLVVEVPDEVFSHIVGVVGTDVATADLQALIHEVDDEMAEMAAHAGRQTSHDPEKLLRSSVRAYVPLLKTRDLFVGRLKSLGGTPTTGRTLGDLLEISLGDAYAQTTRTILLRRLSTLQVRRDDLETQLNRAGENWVGAFADPSRVADGRFGPRLDSAMAGLNDLVVERNRCHQQIGMLCHDEEAADADRLNRTKALVKASGGRDAVARGVEVGWRTRNRWIATSPLAGNVREAEANVKVAEGRLAAIAGIAGTEGVVDDLTAHVSDAGTALAAVLAEVDSDRRSMIWGLIDDALTGDMVAIGALADQCIVERAFKSGFQAKLKELTQTQSRDATGLLVEAVMSIEV